MKVCPICGSRYEEAVDFCFKDGAPLEAGSAVEAVADDGPDSSVDAFDVPDALSLSGMVPVEEDDVFAATLPAGAPVLLENRIPPAAADDDPFSAVDSPLLTGEMPAIQRKEPLPSVASLDDADDADDADEDEDTRTETGMSALDVPDGPPVQDEVDHAATLPPDAGIAPLASPDEEPAAADEAVAPPPAPVREEPRSAAEAIASAAADEDSAVSDSVPDLADLSGTGDFFNTGEAISARLPKDEDDRRSPAWIVLLVACIALVGFIGWMLMNKGSTGPGGETGAGVAVVDPTPAPTATPDPTPDPQEDPVADEGAEGDAGAEGDEAAEGDAGEGEGAEAASEGDEAGADEGDEGDASADAATPEPPVATPEPVATPAPTPQPVATPAPTPTPRPTPTPSSGTQPPFSVGSSGSTTGSAGGNPWTGGSAPVASGGGSDPWGSAAASGGSLSVTSTPPGASVQVGGASRGKTPLTLQLPLGDHEVKVSLDGYAPSTRIVKLATTKTVTVDVGLESLAPKATPAPAAAVGTLNVITTPTSATLWVDGVQKGRTPIPVQISAGRHTFRLVVDGKTPQEEVVDVQIEAGETKTKVFTLK